MHELFADKICRDMEGSVREQPFGPGMVVWTIAGHMFAAYTEAGEGLSLRVGELVAGRMVDEKRAKSEPALTGAGWVLIPWSTPPEEMRRRIAASYAMVLADGNRASAD